MSEGIGRTEMEKMMKHLIENQEFLEAAMKPLAQLLYAKHKALVDAGFTREEALVIIQTRGLNA